MLWMVKASVIAFLFVSDWSQQTRICKVHQVWANGKSSIHPLSGLEMRGGLQLDIFIMTLRFRVELVAALELTKILMETFLLLSILSSTRGICMAITFPLRQIGVLGLAWRRQTPSGAAAVAAAPAVLLLLLLLLPS